MRTLIRQATIVNAAATETADLLIDGERIAAIGTELAVPADRTIDASGRLVVPGGIDAHTHLDLPLDADVRVSDDFRTGTIAAAMGGTTCVIDFATQAPGGSLLAALDAWKAMADGQAVIDYGFHMIVCDWRAPVEAELARLVTEGVTSVKVFTAYPGRLMLDDATLFRVMRRARDVGALVCVHAENGSLIEVLVQEALAAGRTGPREHAATRPARAEAEAVNRAIALAEVAGCALFVVHVSAAESLEPLALGRDRGLPVFGETCPQYLWLDDERYDEPDFGGAKYVMSPPLRRRGNERALWDALARGALDSVGTDHCPFWWRDKRRGRDDFTRIPNGAPGIEHRMSLLYDGGVRAGRLSVNRWVEVTSTAPARIFGLFPRKGVVAVGADADLVVWDPHRRFTISADTHHMRVDYDVYEGLQLTGAADLVFSRGHLVVEQGRFVGRAGAGRFLRRDPHPA